MKGVRPKNLDQVVGNDHIKSAIRVSIGAAKHKNDAFPHTILYGPPGTGKTTLASIIGNEMGGGVKTYLANVFTSRRDVQNLLNELNFENHENNPDPDKFEPILTGPIKPTIVFLDEVHQLPKKVQECFFQAMEDNKFTVDEPDLQSGKRKKTVYWVPKFTLIGATTKPGSLDKAFLERFKLTFTLNPYSEDELARMVSAACERNEIKIQQSAVREIAQRARGIARKALNFVERAYDTALHLEREVIDKRVTEKTFELLNIDGTGLESLDIQVLQYLYKIHPQKIGLDRLSGILNVTENVVKDVIEPYLMRQGLIQAAPKGRFITEKGIEYCAKHRLIPQEEDATRASRRITNA